jgi:hypothetical protein
MVLMMLVLVLVPGADADARCCLLMLMPLLLMMMMKMMPLVLLMPLPRCCCCCLLLPLRQRFLPAACQPLAPEPDRLSVVTRAAIDFLYQECVVLRGAAWWCIVIAVALRRHRKGALGKELWCAR